MARKDKKIILEGVDKREVGYYSTPQFIADYIGSLYKDADAKILDQIETDMSIILKPIKAPCPDCGGEIEVYVNPSMTFQQ